MRRHHVRSFGMVFAVPRFVNPKSLPTILFGLGIVASFFPNLFQILKRIGQMRIVSTVNLAVQRQQPLIHGIRFIKVLKRYVRLAERRERL